jgi:hypothetical protein
MTKKDAEATRCTYCRASCDICGATFCADHIDKQIDRDEQLYQKCVLDVKAAEANFSAAKQRAYVLVLFLFCMSVALTLTPSTLVMMLIGFSAWIFWYVMAMIYWYITMANAQSVAKTK